jgi:hypothetical protein
MKIEVYNDVTYYIGKNAQENWDLLDKFKKENNDYIWFHLNSFSSCYVIMESTIQELKSNESNESNESNGSKLEQYLIHGAELCKENSKYYNYSNLKIIYTSLKKLTKTDKIGEVIISGKKNIITL